MGASPVDVCEVDVCEVVEPATGAVLGSISMADPVTVAESAKSARIAQPAWYATSYEERAMIMRKAAELGELHFGEIVDWIVRKVGLLRSRRLSRLAFQSRLFMKALVCQVVARAKCCLLRLDV